MHDVFEGESIHAEGFQLFYLTVQGTHFKHPGTLVQEANVGQKNKSVPGNTDSVRTAQDITLQENTFYSLI